MRFSGTPRTPAKDYVLCTPVYAACGGDLRSQGHPEPWQRTAVLCTPAIDVDGLSGHCYTMMQGRVIERIERMKSIAAWKYLIVVFAVFWVVLAIMMVIADFPFYIITLSLSIMLVLSAAIVALAWAYQNNL